MAIGTNLKRLLKYKNMTAKELSEKSGISVNTIYRIIQRDSSTVKPETDNKISSVLDLPPNSLNMLCDLEYSITTLILHALNNGLSICSVVERDTFNMYLSDEIHNIDELSELYYEIMDEGIFDKPNLDSLIPHLITKSNQNARYQNNIYNALELVLRKNAYYCDLLHSSLSAYYIIFDIIWGNSWNSVPIDSRYALENSNENEYFLEKLVYNACPRIEFGSSVRPSNIHSVDIEIRPSNIPPNIFPIKIPKKHIDNKFGITIEKIEQHHDCITYKIAVTFDNECSKDLQSLNNNGLEELAERTMEFTKLLAKIPEYQADKKKENNKTVDSGNTAVDNEI